jgi:glycosyltransferase involved in cell wall biosynthesis
VFPKFLLYAANLHVGGGVQVATSVIDEISASVADAGNITLMVSSQVDSNLKAIGTPLERFRGYFVEDHHGLLTIFRNVKKALGDSQAIFVVFGPLYVAGLRVPMIVGFAQPWIIYPNNEIYISMTRLGKLKARLKFALQSFFFRRADLLVVELEHVRHGLSRLGISDANRVRVVQNCLSRLYRTSDRWQPVAALGGGHGFKLGFVGRNYPHKNTTIFPKIKKSLLDNYNLNVSIYVTFSEEEWLSCTQDFRDSVINVGPLNVAQCPSFYQKLDGVLFPSLLECFSATPLEAMAMKRPLFASDRPFNRDICGDYAFYFDPCDPDSAAAAVAACFLDPVATNKKVLDAYGHVITLPGPDIRARLYLKCVRQVVFTPVE